MYEFFLLTSETFFQIVGGRSGYNQDKVTNLRLWAICCPKWLPCGILFLCRMYGRCYHFRFLFLISGEFINCMYFLILARIVYIRKKLWIFKTCDTYFGNWKLKQKTEDGKCFIRHLFFFPLFLPTKLIFSLNGADSKQCFPLYIHIIYWGIFNA